MARRKMRHEVQKMDEVWRQALYGRGGIGITKWSIRLAFRLLYGVTLGARFRPMSHGLRGE